METNSKTAIDPVYGKGGFSNRRFWWFFAISLIINTVQFMSNGSVSTAATVAGFTSSQVGLITSIMGLTAFFIAILAGPMTCIAPPHIIWAVSMWGYALSYFLLSRQTMMCYILGKVIDGIFACFLALAQIRIMRDCCSVEGVNNASSFNQVRNSLAKVMGPILGLNGLCIWLGYKENFLVCSALSLVLGFIVLFTLRLENSVFVPEPFKLKPTNIFTKGCFLPMMIITCCILPQMAMGQFNTVFAKTELGATNIGFMMAFGNIVAVFVAPTIVSFADKIGHKKMLVIGFIIFMVGPIIFSFGTAFWQALVAVGFQYTGFSIISPCIMTLLVRGAPPERASQAANAHGFGMSLGSFFGPFLAGYVVEWFGYRVMYRCLLVPAILGIVLVFVYYNSLTKAKAAG